MGASPVQSLLASLDMKGLLQGNDQQSCSANGSPLGKKQRRSGGHAVKISKRRPTRVLMKRMARVGSRKHANAAVGRRVRTLKRLIPNGESMGSLDGLFREAADYIFSLQMRVRVMQIMVNALTNSDE
ncbi:transcription factor UPBEAT1 [Corylus avellana]|uniref:transcription factor UPBEAT1 n=1 Tax=Corylus avellana TaxID=13451 RepID=UPI001E23D32D|nr:transcription factor UPBEAT1 [Corylus avellana]